MKAFQHQERSNSWDGSKRFAFLWSNRKQRPTLTVFPFESDRTVADKSAIGVKTSTRVEARVWATRIKICEIRYTVKWEEKNQWAYEIPHWWNFEIRSFFVRHLIEGMHLPGADIPLPPCLSERPMPIRQQTRYHREEQTIPFLTSFFFFHSLLALNLGMRARFYCSLLHFLVRFMTGKREKKANKDNCGALTFTMRTTITHRTVAQVSQVIVDFHTHPIMQAGIWVTPISFCFKTKWFIVLELCYNKMIITRARRWHRTFWPTS